MPKLPQDPSVKPLATSPAPECILAYPGYTEAREKMRHSLEPSDDILVLTGPPGIGKTTLVKTFLEELGPDEAFVVAIDASDSSAGGLLSQVASSLGVIDLDQNNNLLLENLERKLRLHEQALLVVDEAHRLDDSAYDDMRLLSYLRSGKGPLLQVVLVGEEPLYARVKECEMAQLKQWRIEQHCLSPLSLQETHDHVVRWLSSLKLRHDPEISSKASILIHRYSRGYPSLIGRLCDQLFEHYQSDKPVRLDVHEVSTSVQAMRGEQPEAAPAPSGSAALLQMHDLNPGEEAAAAHNLSLVLEEKEFIEKNPEVVGVSGAAKVFEQIKEPAAEQVSGQLAVNEPPPEPQSKRGAPWYGRPKRLLGISALVLVGLVGIYQLSENSNSKPQPTVVKVGQPVLSGDAQSEPVAPPAQPQQAVVDKVESPAPEVAVVAAEDLPESDFEELQAVPPTQEVTVDVAELQEVELLARALDRQVAAPAVAGPVAPAETPAETIEAEKIAELLLSGSLAIEKYRLRTPRQKSAYYYYQQVLEMEPGNVMAKQGMELIVVRYTELTSRVISQQEFDKAQLYINRALGVAAGDERLLALQDELNVAREELAAAQELERLQMVQADEQARQDEEAKGLLGTLKKIFTGSSTTE